MTIDHVRWSPAEHQRQRTQRHLIHLTYRTLRGRLLTPTFTQKYLQNRYVGTNYRVTGQYFRIDNMGLSSFDVSCWAPKDTCILKHSAFCGHLRSAKVVDFTAIRKRMRNFLFVLSSNLAPILHRSKIQFSSVHFIRRFKSQKLPNPLLFSDWICSNFCMNLSLSDEG